MEFHEKLQELRKSRNLTQEELAELIFVSRTAISKWESGRGYPSIESLKQISKFFSVSIDDLLSCEKVLYIAEAENKSNIQNMFNLTLGIIDICAFLLIFLPLYPNTVNGYVASVNLLNYIETSIINRILYWILITLVIIVGSINTLSSKYNKNKILSYISIVITIITIFLFAVTKESYALIIALLMLIAKGLIVFKVPGDKK